MNRLFKSRKSIIALVAAIMAVPSMAQGPFGPPPAVTSVTSPDGRLNLEFLIRRGAPRYRVSLDDVTFIQEAPLGFVSNLGDFSQGMELKSHEIKSLDETYSLDRIKSSNVHYTANELKLCLEGAGGHEVDIVFRVSNNDVAFRYEIPKIGETGSIVITEEKTGFDLPDESTTFVCPQSDAMIGWKRSKPSYEEEYEHDAPMGLLSRYGHGYTFPCLFHVGDKGWVLISETGVDSRYCGAHLSEITRDGKCSIAFPMMEENNGNGTVGAGMALPAATAWRTITIGETLKPIMETTVTFDVVEPLYEPRYKYEYGRGSWSWIIWQDDPTCYENQVAYIDLASELGLEYCLIDASWDVTIGYERMEELVEYARSKNVGIFLWYSSSGYWNDIVQTPNHRMDNSIKRKQEMRWMNKIGVKGIKVDFWGGDKQETMRLYEQVLSDADDYGLMVIFHGCTLPRGWERMYPNYVGSEAVLASENLIFGQHACDEEGRNAMLHPFIRNTVGCMEFGGCVLNKRLRKDNASGTIRRISDTFELATLVFFQNPIQMLAVTPGNLTDAPKVCLDYIRTVPTTWDETMYIDGYPGKYTVMARRHGDSWYIAAANATENEIKLNLSLPMLAKGDKVKFYHDDAKTGEPLMEEITIKDNTKIPLTIASNCAAIYVKEE